MQAVCEAESVLPETEVIQPRKSRHSVAWKHSLGARITLLLLAAAPGIGAQSKAAGADFAVVAENAGQAREANRIGEAMALYRQALALRPEWAEGWWYLGTLLYDRDEYREATGAFEKAVALSPRSGNAAAMLGLAEARLGRNQQALHALERARTLGIGEDPE